MWLRQFRHWLKAYQAERIRQLRDKRGYKRLVVLSDLHYPSKAVLSPLGCWQKMAVKEEVLQEINQWNDVDLAVFTGDMVQRDGSLREYEMVRLFLRGLQKRKAFVAGNHELLYTSAPDGHLVPGDLVDRVLRLKQYTRFFSPLYYARRLGGYLLVFLSPGTVSGKVAVQLSEQQLSWLKQTLTKHATLPTLIFCHAPLAGTSCPTADGSSQPSPRNVVQPETALRRILLSQMQVKLWVSGHTHTRPGDPDFMSPFNWYGGQILNVYNGDWDEAEHIYTNSIYLYKDKICLRTYSHYDHCWLAQFDRTIFLKAQQQVA